MLKTLTFAILHFGVAFSVAYVLTGSIGISSTVALVEPIVNTVVFYFHEKVWQRVDKKRRRRSPVGADGVDIEHQKTSDKRIFGCGHVL